MSRILACLVFVSALGCSQEAGPDGPEAEEFAIRAPGPPPDRAEQHAAAFVEQRGGHVERDPSRPGNPVTVVHLFGRATDADLRELVHFKRLGTLSLPCCARITDAGLKELANIPSLTTLDLSYTPVTDEGLKELAALPNLASLTLSGTAVTEFGLKELAALKKLTVLRLGQNRVTDAGVKEIAALKNLTSLTLSGNITLQGLAQLASLTNLTELYLPGFSMTDEGLKAIALLPNLTTLEPGNCRGVTPEGILTLAPLKRLTTVRNGAFLSDRNLAALRKVGLLHAMGMYLAATARGRRNRRTSSASICSSAISPPRD